MDSPENTASELADACIALIQQQMVRLSEEMAEGQEIEAIVPLADGGRILVTCFGFHNPDLIKITGIDGEGNDVCLMAHKNTLQVVLRRVNSRPEGRPQIAFQMPDAGSPREVSLDETA